MKKGEKSICVRPRYCRRFTDPGEEIAEKNFKYAWLEWKIPLNQAALVSVDIWNSKGVKYAPADMFNRVDNLIDEKIVPLAAACRENGLQIIHAPAMPVAEKHPNCVRYLSDKEFDPQAPWPDSPIWPPNDFKEKKGVYSQYSFPYEPQKEMYLTDVNERRTFHKSFKPVANEPVVRKAEELHRLCAEKGILHLFYIGFFTNMCVMNRDYGIMKMTARGYSTILLRDCTTGFETSQTTKDLTCTVGAIATMELSGGFTLSSEELMRALNDKA